MTTGTSTVVPARARAAKRRRFVWTTSSDSARITQTREAAAGRASGRRRPSRRCIAAGSSTVMTGGPRAAPSRGAALPAGDRRPHGRRAAGRVLPRVPTDRVARRTGGSRHSRRCCAGATRCAACSVRPQFLDDAEHSGALALLTPKLVLDACRAARAAGIARGERHADRRQHQPLRRPAPRPGPRCPHRRCDRASPASRPSACGSRSPRTPPPATSSRTVRRAARPPAARREACARRLRHRLRIDRLPARAAARCRQDRPVAGRRRPGPVAAVRGFSRPAPRSRARSASPPSPRGSSSWSSSSACASARLRARPGVLLRACRSARPTPTGWRPPARLFGPPGGSLGTGIWPERGSRGQNATGCDASSLTPPGARWPAFELPDDDVRPIRGPTDGRADDRRRGAVRDARAGDPAPLPAPDARSDRRRRSGAGDVRAVHRPAAAPARDASTSARTSR